MNNLKSLKQMGSKPSSTKWVRRPK